MQNSYTRTHKTLIQYFEHSVDNYPDNIAVECDHVAYSYQELERRANQLAHYLMRQGVGQNTLVCILLDRSIDVYISILAVLKTGAAYIPIEIEYPAERINDILNDVTFHAMITSSRQQERQDVQFSSTIVLNQLDEVLSIESNQRPSLRTLDDDHLCYVIYTSGSTGKPKGVEVMHRSICHYVSSASSLYQMSPADKVYQGFSLAFDASLEELWMAFANGATLVACTSKEVRSGIGLVSFLTESNTTVFSTVPTLLSSLEEQNIPGLRLLILGGEACLPGLIKQYSRPGLRIMNTYGPTEATVIATYTECFPDKPITLGKPLPGYTLSILDQQLNPVRDGIPGELCIGGMGLARGYVNRPELTAMKFVNHPQENAHRLYRTGDLVSINPDGDLLFLGRVDDQVKIRGFRVELNEIEAVMMTHPAIQGAVVLLHDALDRPELAAYFILNKNVLFDLQEFKAFLRQKLPHYMIPASFDILDTFPVVASGKVNRKAFPKPSMTPEDTDYIAPATVVEQAIAKVFQLVLKNDRISVHADFFYDLGGHSLLAAKVVSLLRQQSAFSTISILDLYSNPTIGQLAKKMEGNAANSSRAPEENKKYHVSTLRYALCGVGQFFGCLFQYALEAWQFLLIVLLYNGLESSGHFFSMRSVGLMLALFFGLPLVSMAIIVCMKWILLGRVKPGQYKLWGWFYFRWWLVDRLSHFIFPAKHLVGTPLINLYYRLLGAKIGANCYLGAGAVGVYDTLTIGENSSIGYDVRMLGFQVEDGWFNIGAITIGRHCFIGSRSVISHDTTIQDGAGLDHMSLVSTGSSIPAHSFYGGSPARETEMPPEHIMRCAPKPVDRSRFGQRVFYFLLHYFCFVFAGLVHYVSYLPGVLLMMYVMHATHSFFSLLYMAPIGAIISMMVYYLCVGVCVKGLSGQSLSALYPVRSLYYVRQWVIAKLLDAEEVAVLADSLYFPPLLRFLGANLGRLVEMGEAPHLMPHFVTLDDEAFTASGVGLAWPTMHNGWVQYAPIRIGKGAFSGNVSLLPAGYSVGDNGLLGSLTAAPSNQQAAQNNTSWLGSPAIFLPKRELFTQFSVEDTLKPPMRLYFSRLMIELIRVILPTTYTLIGFLGLIYALDYLLAHYSLFVAFCVLPFAEPMIICTLVVSIIGFKWIIQGKLKPTVKPLWDLFIRKIDLIEFSWSFFIQPHLAELILGTPFMPMLLRLLGTKIGKKTYIGTAQFAEFDLISIGDNVCLNTETLIDTHLYEDRIFKVSTIDIHDGCNVGVGSVILYDTVMEKNASLGHLSLLMKGERLPENTRWQGIPAQSDH